MCWEVTKGIEAYGASPLDLTNVLDPYMPPHPVERDSITLVGRRASSMLSNAIREQEAAPRRTPQAAIRS